MMIDDDDYYYYHHHHYYYYYYYYYQLHTYNLFSQTQKSNKVNHRRYVMFVCSMFSVLHTFNKALTDSIVSVFKL